jgi:hypothetical protein
MRGRNAISLLAVVLTAGALTVGGIWAAVVESAPYYLTYRPSPSARFQALAEGRVPVGLSTASQLLYLRDCRDALGSLVVLAQPERTRRATAENCLAQADRFAARSPVFSAAWLTGAVAAVQLEDRLGARERLYRSQLTAPSEQWIIEHRVQLATRLGEHIGGSAAKRFDADLKVLLSTYEGTRTIAQLIADNPEFRERVIGIAEQFNEAEQQRVLDNLSRLLGQLRVSP